MNTLPQYEFETAIYRILEYGDISEIANAVGKSPAYYSQMLNPEDPRESIWFRAARDIINLIQKDPERGCSVLEVFNYYVRRSVPREVSCVKSEAVRFNQEAHDVAAAAITGEPLYKQYVEAIQARDQADKLAESLLALINEEKETPNAGRTRINGNGTAKARTR